MRKPTREKQIDHPVGRDVIWRRDSSSPAYFLPVHSLGHPTGDVHPSDSAGSCPHLTKNGPEHEPKMIRKIDQKCSRIWTKNGPDLGPKIFENLDQKWSRAWTKNGPELGPKMASIWTKTDPEPGPKMTQSPQQNY